MNTNDEFRLKKENEPMINKSISIQKSLWDLYMEKSKSKGQSLSWIIRRLLEKWFAGEIEL